MAFKSLKYITNINKLPYVSPNLEATILIVVIKCLHLQTLKQLTFHSYRERAIFMTHTSFELYNIY